MRQNKKKKREAGLALDVSGATQVWGRSPLKRTLQRRGITYQKAFRPLKNRAKSLRRQSCKLLSCHATIPFRDSGALVAEPRRITYVGGLLQGRISICRHIAWKIQRQEILCGVLLWEIGWACGQSRFSSQNRGTVWRYHFRAQRSRFVCVYIYLYAFCMAYTLRGYFLLPYRCGNTT